MQPEHTDVLEDEGKASGDGDHSTSQGQVQVQAAHPQCL